MIDFFRDIRRAISRRIGYWIAGVLLAAILGLAGIGKASAQNPALNCGDLTKGRGNPATPSDTPVCADHGEALVMAKAVAMKQRAESPWANQPITSDIPYVASCGGPVGGIVYCHVKHAIFSGVANLGTRYYRGGNDCLSRNASLGTGTRPTKWIPGDGDTTCIHGCTYKAIEDKTLRTVHANTAGQPSVQTGKMLGSSAWEYTGDTCQVPTGEESKPRTEEKQNKPECVPAGSGRTYCIKPNGDYCATAKSGRAMCWAPGEQGIKNDGDISQESKQGTHAPSPPEGSTHTNTTNITNTTNNTTTNTTVNNYQTNNGSPAGPVNQGQGTDGSGAPSGQPGGTPGGTGTNPGDDGDDDTASGGSGCESPPTSTGNAILGAILKQTYETRCAIEKGLGSLEGEGECSEHGTVVAFSCSGDTVGCALALRARERGCKEAQANQQLVRDGEGSSNGDEGGEIWGTGDGIGNLNGSLISVGGGGDLVPIVSLGSQTVDLNGPVGNLVAILKMIIIAAAAAAAAFIAGGRN
ncbi:hypothetical protein [Thermomonas sp.]|uniref:hypothetical protein n=1 Tax=Thermomonas sp. TaxID=1971895 RepID=UPI0035AFA4A0